MLPVVVAITVAAATESAIVVVVIAVLGTSVRTKYPDRLVGRPLVYSQSVCCLSRPYYRISTANVYTSSCARDSYDECRLIVHPESATSYLGRVDSYMRSGVCEIK